MPKEWEAQSDFCSVMEKIAQERRKGQKGHC